MFSMKDITPHTIQNRIAKLQEERKRILALPAEKALDAVLESPEALPLVHSFPVDDFYFLIHDIGLEDSLQLLSMASSKQWEYILDQEIWEKDRVDNQSVVKWFDLFLKSDSNRFVKWLRDDRLDIAELFLFRNIEVIKREHDEDPSDFGSGYFTLDDVYYIKIIDSPLGGWPDTGSDELRERVITSLLKKVAEDDYIRYQMLLTETTAVIPAEAEEEAYRLKNVRLAEKGFLPFEEAVGIYQPLTPGEKGLLTIKKAEQDADEKGTVAGVPYYHLAMMDEQNVFARALMSLDQSAILSNLQVEFGTLCNTLVAADNKKIRGKESLGGIVRKACGYISLGFSRISEGKDEPTLQQAHELIQQYPLSQIFRTGYGMALDLQKQIREWRKKSRLVENGLPLSFWGEEYMGVIGGLLLKRPLFFDNYRQGVLYRDFQNMSDIMESRSMLSDIMVMDDLLSLMSINFKPLPDHFLTYKNLLLTLWARNRLDLPMEAAPIGLDKFLFFYKFMFSNYEKSDRTEDEATIDASVKESFLYWLSEETKMTVEKISLKAGHILESLFREIESEYGRVSVQDLDPRYGVLFLLEQEAKNEY
ncbi:MAG: hypothetical protein JRF40_06920 [Deltaproteobacteria bacterium]|nr:hypothetical protein [Deltaproteobacteria bacterium]